MSDSIWVKLQRWSPYASSVIGTFWDFASHLVIPYKSRRWKIAVWIKNAGSVIFSIVWIAALIPYWFLLLRIELILLVIFAFCIGAGVGILSV